MGQNSYWDRAASRRLSRRGVLRGSAVAGLGIAGAALIGCGDDDAAGTAGTPTGGAAATTTPAGAAATATASAPEVKTGGTHIAHFTTPYNDEMDPHKSTSQAANIWSHMGNTGTRLNREATEVVGELVESWEFASDTELVLKTRAGAKWHDKGVEAGRALDAEDAAYNLMRIAGKLEPEQSARYQRRTTMTGMVSAEAVDATTVKVTFERPTSTFLSGMSDFRSSWFSKDFIDGGGDFNEPASMVGTGAFVLDEWENEVRATFSRNPNYWRGEGRPYLDKVEWVWLPDATAALTAFSQDQVHHFPAPTSVQRETLKQLAKDAREEVWVFGNWNHWRFNPQRAPFDDPRVRRALFLVPRYKEMMDTILGDGYWDFTGPLPSAYPEGYPAEDIATQPGWNPASKEADIQEAKDLMTAAGFPDGAITFGMMPSGPTQSGTFFESGIRIQDQLKAVWPAMQANFDLPADTATFGKRQVEGDFDTILYVIFPQPDPVLELSSQYHTSGSRNYGKFSDTTVDELLGKASQQLDPAERTATLRELQDLLINDHMYIVTTSQPRQTAWFPNYIKGMEGFGGRVDGGGYDIRRHTEGMWYDK